VLKLIGASPHHDSFPKVLLKCYKRVGPAVSCTLTMLACATMQPTPGALGWAETASNWKAPNFESFFQESLDTHLPSRLQQNDDLQHLAPTDASPADVKSEAGR
jgi:hypothetical protein